MTLELEINAATRAYLPKEALTRSSSVKRFELKAPSGESQVLIGQIVHCHPSSAPKDEYEGMNCREYCLVFRPESSEPDVNFVAERNRNGNNNHALTRKELRALNWTEEFSHILTDYQRPWILPQSENSRYILFSSDRECNGIYGHKPNGAIAYFRCPIASDGEQPLLKWSNAVFGRYFSNLYDDTESDLRFALKWMELSLEEKNEIAFTCGRGSWSELRQIARWVLQIRLGVEESLVEEEYFWMLTSFDRFPRARDESQMIADTNYFLYDWRAFLMQHFQAEYIDGDGAKMNAPCCLRNHLLLNGDSICVNRPTAHEAMEAQFQLSNWLKANSISKA